MPRQVYRTAAGVEVPGVTTVIGDNLGWNKHQLIAWASRKGKDTDKIRDNGAAVGTALHARIEAYLRGGAAPLSEEMLRATDASFDAFEKWIEGKHVELLALETPLVSELLLVGGCPDLICRLHLDPTIKPQVVLVDWKSSDFYLEHLVQSAAYRLLWNEAFPETPIEQILVLSLPKDGRPYDAHYFDVEAEEVIAASQVFRDLVSIHGARRRLQDQLVPSARSRRSAWSRA